MNEHLIIPILRIFDEAKACEFYIDFLGFMIDFEHRFGDDFPLYMQVSLSTQGKLMIYERSEEVCAL